MSIPVWPELQITFINSLETLSMVMFAFQSIMDDDNYIITNLETKTIVKLYLLICSMLPICH